MDTCKKRPHSADSDEEFELSNIHVSKSAKVHGVMTSLSPVKASSSGRSKFFHGELTDGKVKVRFVGFDPKKYDTLSEFYKNRQPLALSDCSVNESKYTPDLEVVVKKSTQLLHSPTKFEVPNDMFEAGDNEHVTIDEISQLPNYQRVSVTVKVVVENDPVEVRKDLTKQEYVIGDSTGCCQITTWEDNVGLFSVGQSYKLSNLMVRSFKGKKYLSIPKDGFQVSTVQDIGIVKEDTIEELVKEKTLKSVSIVGVRYLQTYESCYSCSGKVSPENANSGHCNRCGTIQLLERCKLKTSATLDLQCSKDNSTYSLTAFSPILEQICNGSANIETLLSCDAFDLCYSDKNIISSIKRYIINNMLNIK